MYPVCFLSSFCIKLCIEICIQCGSIELCINCVCIYLCWIPMWMYQVVFVSHDPEFFCSVKTYVQQLHMAVVLTFHNSQDKLLQQLLYFLNSFQKLTFLKK